MKLSQFKFELPEELIALHPASRHRDECRMMVVHRRQGNDKDPESFIEHKIFKDILSYFDDRDLVLLNDTRVFPARLYGNKEKTGAQIEVFLLRELNRELRYWDVLVEPARKIRIGNKLYFSEDDSIVAEVIDNTTSRGRTLRFLYDTDYEAFRTNLFALGQPPLPDYIISRRKAEPEDEEDYQTIFAENEGAVALPSACRHFSKELLKRMEIKVIDYDFITSHIGLGNFKRIDVEDLTKHKMDSENMIITQRVADIVAQKHKEDCKICAVGPDVMRALETVVGTDGFIKAYDGWTNKFIFPPYEFTVANSMIANFYMPYSSWLMLTAAFGGYERIMKAYSIAIKEGYLFGDYGDAMLIVD